MGEQFEMQRVARRRAAGFIAVLGWLVLVAAPAGAAGGEAGPGAEQAFERIVPIFEGRCISCHNSYGTSEGDLSLDRAAAALEPADRRPVIDLDEPADSLLLRVVTGPEPKMPARGEELSDEQVEALRAWIAAGAPWPAGVELHDRPDISTDWWSLKPLRPQVAPEPDAPAELGEWVRNPIDAFVLEKLVEQGMRPSEEADRRTLIRRLYFDLVGLPPTPEQVEAFVADDDPRAYARVVDELLASPHYGERWARHWMDVARYAESHGHDEDVPRENAWPYRDYLIRAFNEGKAYGRFIEEQIAGDVLYPDDPWATAALGFLAAGPWDQSSQMGIVDGTHDKLVAQVIDRDEMISAAVGSLNSVTVACARCHGHKFDPVSKDDYYALQAVFAGVDRVDVPFDPDPAVYEQRRELERREAELAQLGDEDLLDEEIQRRVARWEQRRAEAGDMWHPLEPTDVATAAGSDYERLGDQSVLFSGEQERDVYTIRTVTDERQITAVRLEALTHASLPENGPGRAPNGNITLSDFQVHAAPVDGDGEPRRVEIGEAFSSFDQEHWTIGHALDGNLSTGWGIFPDVGRSHEAVFVFAAPLDMGGPVELAFTLNHNHGGAHIIGRPRLSVTGSADPWSIVDVAGEADAAGGVTAWESVEPATVVAEEGSTFETLGDRSVLFTGEAPETETYRVSGGTELRGVTAVRLEVLPHDTLPGGGPGRSPEAAGNLHLSEFEVLAAPSREAERQRVGIARAVASFDQAGWTIGQAIDGNRQTAWGIHPEEGRAHEAVFVFDEPLDFEQGARLTFVLRQLHGGQHVIGRLRLSVTDAEDPGIHGPSTELAAILETPGESRTAEQGAALARFVLEREIERGRAALPERQMVYAVATDFEPRGNYRPAGGPRPVHVLRRGDIDQPMEEAGPGALSWLDDLPGRFELDDPEDEGARRAALARWLSDERNVMTWRSVVNRVWHYHFGRGIVATPDDFGRMGAEPTHAELLDYLALWFRDEAGQSLKELHRLIVTSATYRQATTHRSDYAERDGENRYLWRMNRRRMAAEQVTDAVLAISGTLDRTMGGPSVRQFVQSPGVHETPEVDYQGFDPDDAGNHRRAVYRFHMRTLPDPLMESLDCPSGSQGTPVRGESVTPLQALAMMNSPFMIRQAEHFAARLEGKSADVGEQVRELYRLALQREPTEREQAGVSGYAEEHGLAAACRLVFNANAFMFLD